MVRVVAALVLALALVPAPRATAGTVLADAFLDFVPGVDAGDVVMPAASGTGSWRYLASATLNPSDPGAGLADLQWDSTAMLFERPGENHTNGFSDDALALGPTGTITMHPSNVSDVVVARWIAGPGEGGDVHIVGNVRKGDAGGGDGIRFLVFVDGTSLFDELVAFDDTTGIPFALTRVPVVEGSTVDFVVSKNGDPFFDTTHVGASVLPAPEPGAPLMLGLGALVLWSSGRSRRRA